MKKIKYSTIYYVVAIIFFICAILEFLLKSGDNTGFLWLALGFVFFFLGEQSKKKNADQQNKPKEKSSDKSKEEK